MDLKTVIAKAKIEKSTVLIRGQLIVTPYWDHFIKHFNYQYNNKDYPHSVSVGSKTVMVNGTLIKDSFYVSAFQATDVFFPQLKYVFSYLESIYGDVHDNAFTLLNYVGGQTPVQVHMDRRDSFYWQCIGTSRWEIYGSQDSDTPLTSYDLNPGDLIFVPEGVFHSIVAPEPRAAISICFNSKTRF